MNLDAMRVRLRPRTPWEALDLGMLLVRDNLRAVYGAWLAAYVPVAIVVCVALRENLFWAWVVMWWLKPAFDRLLLAVLSRGLLGEGSALRPLLAAWPATLWRSGIVSALTWRRFDLARSFHLPVRQLERLRGRDARRRTAVLDRDARGAAVWLTFVLANLEGLFMLAVSLLLAFMLDVQTPVDTLLQAWMRGIVRSEHGSLVGTAIALGMTTLLEPLYVASGFMLYVHRRTQLEGWDIELRFRQMGQRLRALAAPAVRAALGGVLLAVLLAPLCGPARAEEPQATPAAHDAAPRDPAAEVARVLADPVFGEKTTARRIKYVGPTWESKTRINPDFSWWKWLMSMGAQVTRAAAWTAAAIALGFVLYYLARYVRMRSRAAAPRERPDFLFGLDVRAESLPADVASTAEALARAGRVREALSLLYRGALVRFMDDGLELRRGDTEGDCLTRVGRAAAPARAAYFRPLVHAWQSLAYGHQAVDAESALTLARGWRDAFGRPGAQPA